MITDQKEILSDAQALTVSAASTNYIDFGKDRNIGMGEPMAIVILVKVAADGTTTDETYKFGIQTDDNSGFTSPAVVDERTIPYAQLTLNSQHVLPIAPDLRMERYLRLYATLGGTTPSITITAALMPMSDINQTAVYPSGYTVG